MTQIVIWNIFLEPLDEKSALGSRSDETHFALKDVEHLRNFVDSEFANDCADAGYPRITFRRPYRTYFRFGILGHGAKFTQHEAAIILTNALLPVKNRSTAFKLDGDSGQQDERHAQNQSDKRNHHIDGTFRGENNTVTAKSRRQRDPFRWQIRDRDFAGQAFIK